MSKIGVGKGQEHPQLQLSGMMLITRTLGQSLILNSGEHIVQKHWLKLENKRIKVYHIKIIPADTITFHLFGLNFI